MPCTGAGRKEFLVSWRENQVNMFLGERGESKHLGDPGEGQRERESSCLCRTSLRDEQAWRWAGWEMATEAGAEKALCVLWFVFLLGII